MTAAMSDLERTACAILQYHLNDLYDAEVREWLTRVATDPDYDESCPMEKHPNNSSHLYTGPNFTELAKEIGMARAAYADAMHRAIINFGMALCTYRSTGRPAPNTSVYLGETPIVSIDVADQIYHFHTRIAGAWSNSVRMLDSFVLEQS
jgi:hypothetical protein